MNAAATSFKTQLFLWRRAFCFQVSTSLFQFLLYKLDKWTLWFDCIFIFTQCDNNTGKASTAYRLLLKNKLTYINRDCFHYTAWTTADELYLMHWPNMGPLCHLMFFCFFTIWFFVKFYFSCISFIHYAKPSLLVPHNVKLQTSHCDLLCVTWSTWSVLGMQGLELWHGLHWPVGSSQGSIPVGSLLVLEPRWR